VGWKSERSSKAEKSSLPSVEVKMLSSIAVVPNCLMACSQTIIYFKASNFINNIDNQLDSTIMVY